MKIDREAIRRRYQMLSPALDERQRRLWAGAEAEAIGHGGIAAVANATGLAISTVTLGRNEVRRGVSSDGLVRVRKAGGGRRRREAKDPGLVEALEALVEPGSRGDPESPLRWTCKSTRALAREISAKRCPISPQKVGSLLAAQGYSLQAPSKTLEGADHPDRNAQFEYINRRAAELIAKGLPVISVDSKKKELVGEFKTSGREWRPKGQPIKVQTHDFIDGAKGKAIPYGVFDVVDNNAVVNVGVDHDTPTFAVRSIELWWEQLGAKRYPNATELFITADAGGSNSYRSRVWKSQLQRLADHLNLTIHVSHFPPGTSKWNKIEHRLFSFITLNWRGRPLSTYETIIKLISSTTTTKGLRVFATMDENSYPLGQSISEREMRALALKPDAFRGDWNYSLYPHHAADVNDAVASPAPRARLRKEAWAGIQRDAAASGLTLAAYCREKDLSYGAIRAQRYRMKKSASSESVAADPNTSSQSDPAEPSQRSRVKRKRRSRSRWHITQRAIEASGLSIAEYCRREGLSYDAIRSQRRRLKQAEGGKQRSNS